MSVVMNLLTRYRADHKEAYNTLVEQIKAVEYTPDKNPLRLLALLADFKNTNDTLINFIRDNFDTYWHAVSKLYKVLDATKAWVWNVITGGIPRATIKLTVPRSLYALCIDLYGDTSNVDDIKNHNRIFDPLYITAGTELSVPQGIV